MVPTSDTNTVNSAALTNDWLNGNVTNTSLTYTNWWPWYSYPIYVPAERRPIRLSLPEIEKLRAAARKDKAIRGILEKFTDHIEIAVDFE